MRGNELLDKMELVNPAYIAAADADPKRRGSHLKRWCAAAACICLVFYFAVPAMAAASPAFYHVLYAVSPAAAQFFKPVQSACTDNGIRMEVEASYIHADTAEIYISMQDLEGTRFDETIDLFDSYRIHTPFGCTSHCELADYDPDTQTAAFLVTITQWNKQNIAGSKLTFSVGKILGSRKSYGGVISGVDLGSAALNTMTQTVRLRGIGGTELLEEYGTASPKEAAALKPAESIASPVEGVSLTGIGYVDGNLHVQMYYADILKTDNHGFVALQNKDSSEIIHCSGSIAFFDEAGKGSYEDYIFTGVAAETLGAYELYGDFTVSSGVIEGDWNVTFPLEDTDSP